MSYNRYDNMSFCHQWVRFDKIIKYINLIRLKEFSIKKNRDEFRNYLTCDVQYVVDTRVRFPIDFNMYFDLNEGLFSVLYMRLLSILDNQDRKYSESNGIMEKSMDDAKVAWYHTLTDVYTMLHSVKGPDSILGVFDRRLYEREKCLIWNEESTNTPVVKPTKP